MVSHIYPSELKLNKANTSATEAAFIDLHLSISNDIVSTKIYDKRDDFDFEIVNFPFLDGDVPRSTSWCLVMVERLFLAVPRGCLQFVIVVFPDHTHLLFYISLNSFVLLKHLAMLLTSTLAINC